MKRRFLSVIGEQVIPSKGITDSLLAAHWSYLIEKKCPTIKLSVISLVQQSLDTLEVVESVLLPLHIHIQQMPNDAIKVLYYEGDKCITASEAESKYGKLAMKMHNTSVVVHHIITSKLKEKNIAIEEVDLFFGLSKNRELILKEDLFTTDTAVYKIGQQYLNNMVTDCSENHAALLYRMLLEDITELKI